MTVRTQFSRGGSVLLRALREKHSVPVAIKLRVSSSGPDRSLRYAVFKFKRQSLRQLDSLMERTNIEKARINSAAVML